MSNQSVADFLVSFSSPEAKAQRKIEAEERQRKAEEKKCNQLSIIKSAKTFGEIQEVFIDCCWRDPEYQIDGYTKGLELAKELKDLLVVLEHSSRTHIRDKVSQDHRKMLVEKMLKFPKIEIHLVYDLFRFAGSSRDIVEKRIEHDVLAQTKSMRLPEDLIKFAENLDRFAKVRNSPGPSFASIPVHKAAKLMAKRKVDIGRIKWLIWNKIESWC